MAADLAPFDFELRFPPLPRTITEVSRLLAADEPDPEALAAIISTDPAVSATLLRRINSVFYGLRGNIATVERAVMLLGFEATCNVALTAGLTGLRQLLRDPAQVEVYHGLVRRSLGAAHFAQVLVTEVQLREAASLAFTVGLLSTSGQFVLLYNKPEAYTDLVRKHANGGVPPAAVERMALGRDHTAVAQAAAAAWNLPEAVEQVLGGYLTPGRLDSYLRPLAWALSVGLSAVDQLCPATSKAEDEDVPLFIPPPALAALARESEVAVERLAEVVFAERARAQEFIELVLSD
ncbi:MAG: HDOD domain-containing protein [Rhodothermales bacterium]|nr:HDOD domain-containing protein [Rhodothermales bacterium]